MSATTDILIKNLAKNIVENQNKKPSAYDTSAEVRRIEGDTAWVHIPGGVDETPVQLTTNAKKGDVVQVRVSGGRAWLYGNVTSPPTDDTVANKAQKTAAVADEHATNAVTSAMLAQQFADAAKDAADSAQADATIAKTVTDQIVDYAERAEESVEQILDDGVQAKRAAKEAWDAAASAQWQLGAVEDVVGTLEWIANHAIYVWTEDTTPEKGKWYYNLVATPVESGSEKLFDLESGKYYTRILINSDYIYKSADPDGSLDPQTTYYTIVAQVVTVADDSNPHNSFLYEIESYDKTVRDYIYTYLTLDDNGLHLNDGDINNRIDISTTNGVEIYNAGKKIAQYGANTIIGKEESFHIEITPEQLSFVTGKNGDVDGVVVAFMSGEVLNIPRVVVVDSMQIGSWIWDGKSNVNHLTLRWIGE